VTTVDAVNVGLDDDGIVLAEMLMLVALEGQQVEELGGRRVVGVDDVKGQLHAIIGLQWCALKRSREKVRKKQKCQQSQKPFRRLR